MRRPLLLVALLAAFLSSLFAQEVQLHGLVFEEWIRDTFFDGYKPTSYTQRWDIPAAANKNHGAIPVNPKAIKQGSAIDLGDALRQYEIDESFMLVVGFWEQHGDDKRIVNIAAPVITPELWRTLWGPVKYEDLQRLERVIKDNGPHITEVRANALRMKNAPPFTQAIIQVNPKIDSNGQRRLQCSIRFSDFYKYLMPGADPKSHPSATLFGQEFPNPIASKPRTFKK
ncbi:hypothetical protein [Oleiharenicola lentus]|uniref:hypothetical protein n=1 Tax=Oleiharenicola lentus TaxID=2508720 RepID=UPI003F667E04